MFSFSEGKILAAKVQAVISVEADAYYEISVGGHVLRLTGEHPVATAPGVFRIASSLEPGDRVLIGDQSAVAAALVASVKRLPATKLAYNLLVSPGGTFLANGVVVHNKGCFLPETLVRRADGTDIAISTSPQRPRAGLYDDGCGSRRHSQNRGDSRCGSVQGGEDTEPRGPGHGGAPLLYWQRHIQDIGIAQGRRLYLRL